MIARLSSLATSWTSVVPVLAVVLLVFTWGRDLPGAVVVLVTLVLAGAVLAAVHHAEVVAHRVGEPFGSLVLAVAVTIIEVALIVTLMADGGDKSSTLARDTVFAAVMITCNGIVGISLLVASLRHGTAVFNPEGTGAALATVATLATLSLVLPTFTTSKPGPEFSTTQLTFAALSSLVLYGLFVATQTVRHRDYFLPITRQGELITGDDHADVPTARTALISLGLLGLALIGVVGLAKGVSPTIESGVAKAGLPHAVVGVIIALLVLLPETIAALRSARRDRVQTSLNLALGSAMASIGLTIPAVALASVWLSGPLVLGLGATHMVLLALTVEEVVELDGRPGERGGREPRHGGRPWGAYVVHAASTTRGDQELRRGVQAGSRRRGARGAGAARDPQELQLLRVGGTRRHRVDDEAEVAAGDGEHVAVAEHLADLGVHDGLAGRDVRSDRPLVPQPGELRAGGAQFFHEAGQAAVAGVAEESRAQVGDEGGAEALALLEHEPGREPRGPGGEDGPDQVPFGVGPGAGVAQQHRPGGSPGQQGPVGAEHGCRELPEAGQHALDPRGNVRGDRPLLGRQEPGQPVGVVAFRGL